MSKNLFAILNGDCKFWVDIFNLKYGSFELWKCPKIPKSSSFYKAICMVAEIVRSNLALNTCCQTKIDLWWDPWCFDILLARKPTFVNMEL